VPSKRDFDAFPPTTWSAVLALRPILKTADVQDDSLRTMLSLGSFARVTCEPGPDSVAQADRKA
jgi:hypothetical protein